MVFNNCIDRILWLSFSDINVVNERNNSGKIVHRIILGLEPHGNHEASGFKFIRYAYLFSSVRTAIGKHLHEANPKFLTIFLDFIQTIENLVKETAMDSEFVKLLQQNEDTITSLWAEVYNYREELRKPVKELGSLIKIPPNVNQWCYRENAETLIA